MNLRTACMSLALACCATVQAHDAPPTTLLEDAHRIRVAADGSYTLNRLLRYRIRNARAIKGQRIETFLFNQYFESLQLQSAYVRRRDGSRRPLPLSAGALRRVPAQAGEPHWLDNRALRLTFSNLRIGDEVVVRVRIASKRLSFPGTFQMLVEPAANTADPALRVRIDAPADYQLHAAHHGFVSLGPVAAHGRIRYEWAGDGDPNLRREVMAADTTAYSPRVVLSHFTDFAELARLVDPYYWRLSRPDASLRRLSAAIIDGIPDQRGQALAIHRWVQQHLRYRAVYHGKEPWVPQRTAARILQARQGDCKDHAVVMAAMLAAAGIDSTPALIEWGTDGYTLQEPAYFGSFNHVISYIPGLDLYLDATAKHIGGAYLPPDQLGKVTLLTRSGALGRTPAHQLDRRDVRYAVDIAPDLGAQFAFKVQAEGYQAGQQRQEFSDHARYPAGAWVKAQLDRWGMTGQGEEEFGDTTADLPSYRYSYTGRLAPFLSGETSPAFRARTSLTAEIGLLVDAMLAEKSRTHPFACLPREIEEHASYALPAQLDAGPLPPDVNISTPAVRYHATYRHEGRSILIDRHLDFGLAGGGMCPAAEFDTVEPAMQTVRRDLQQNITLVPATLATSQPQ